MENVFNGKAVGGHAKNSKMSEEERKKHSLKMLEGKKKKSKLIKATHGGELKIGNISIPCHVLENEKRVISGRGMQLSLGFSKSASGMALSALIDTKLKDFLTEDSINQIKTPIQFSRIGSGGAVPETNGYDATLFIDICDALIQAKKENALTPAQSNYADQAEIIIRSVAKVGIIALVDEATGYQKDRARDALAKILEAFIAKELQPWIKTFDNDYYENMFRLRETPYPPDKTNYKPSYFGILTNDIVYKRLAPGVLKALKEEAKKEEKKTHLHRHLTAGYGRQELIKHLGLVVGLMKLSKNWDDFILKLNTISPKYGDTLDMGM